jgi:uncharacterized protein
MPRMVPQRLRSLSPALAVLVSCLLLAACSLVTPAASPLPGDAVPAAAQAGSDPATGTAADAATQRARRAAAPSKRPSEITQDIEGAVTSVETYWRNQFSLRDMTFEPVERVYAYTPGDGSTCGRQLNVPRNAAYCVPNDDIGFDVQWTAETYRALGDAFVYYLIGHEYAHAIQQRLGVNHKFTIQFELQADCWAGAYIGDQVRAGVLTLEKGDVPELAAGLRSVGDPAGTPWFDPRAHGSAAERMAAFNKGFVSSLPACPADGGITLKKR